MSGSQEAHLAVANFSKDIVVVREELIDIPDDGFRNHSYLEARITLRYHGVHQKILKELISTDLLFIWIK